MSLANLSTINCQTLPFHIVFIRISIQREVSENIHVFNWIQFRFNFFFSISQHIPTYIYFECEKWNIIIWGVNIDLSLYYKVIVYVYDIATLLVSCYKYENIDVRKIQGFIFIYFYFIYLTQEDCIINVYDYN